MYRCSRMASGGHGDRVNTSSRRPRSTVRPVSRRRSRASRRSPARAPLRGKTISARPCSSSLSPRPRRRRRCQSARIRASAIARDPEPHRVVVPRAGDQLVGGTVGQHPAAGDDDRPGADRLDLFEQMGRDDDCLFRPHRRDDPAHLVFLVGVEPVGRLVEDHYRRVVDQRLRHADAAAIALRQRFDPLVVDIAQMHELGDLRRPLRGLRR